MMSTQQKFCLKWNDFQASVTSVFETLRHSEELVDISLCCEGRTLKAHRMMLSACSPYFRDLFKDNPCQHPVFFLKGPTFDDLASVLDFVYRGEVNVLQTQLNSFLKTAEMLQVRGLTASTDSDGENSRDTETGAGSCDSPLLELSAQAASPSAAAAPRPLPRLTPRPPSPRTHSSPSQPPPAKRRRSPTDDNQRTPAPEPHASHGVAMPTDNNSCVEQFDGELPVATVKFEPLLEFDLDDSSLDAKMEEVEVDFDDVNLGMLERGSEGADLGAAEALTAGRNSIPSNATAGDEFPTSTPAENNKPGGEWDSRRGAFRCPYCNRLYTHLVSLGQHMKVHQGDTTCHVCGKVLSRTTQLRIHLRQIHGVLEMPPTAASASSPTAAPAVIAAQEKPLVPAPLAAEPVEGGQ